MPAHFTHALALVRPLAFGTAGLCLAALLAVAVHKLLYRGLTRLAANRDLFWRSVVARTAAPTRLGAIALAVALAKDVLPLPRGQQVVLSHLTEITGIILAAWLAQAVFHVWSTVYLRRFKLDAVDNLVARKHVTQIRILRRVYEVVLVLVTIAACLMTVDGVRQYGVSLLASAGAASIVIGLALQPVLKNLFAGIQLAITQPIRIDDALLVEGEWGNVEEITATYVVLRIWDWRRMVLPLSYFIEKPFQNWTREGASLIGTVMIYLDYTVPVEAIRTKVKEIAQASRDWDGNVAHVQITDFRETSMEIRILVSAPNSPRAFDLRCEVREKLIDYLRAHYPQALPHTRLHVEPAARHDALVPAL